MPFDTQLDEKSEPQFQAWLADESKRRKRDVSLDLQDYDLRGYWLGGGWKDTTGEGHLPDTYKKPNHPTFSVESKYHDGKEYQGGTWEGDSVFVPGLTNKKYWGDSVLTDYFLQHEKGVRLKKDKK